MPLVYAVIVLAVIIGCTLWLRHLALRDVLEEEEHEPVDHPFGI